MLPKKQRRQDHATLIWEYLDGDTSPTRLDRLSQLLETRPEVREQFVESAMLHGMLNAHFQGVTPEQPDTRQADPGQTTPQPRRRTHAA